MDFQTHLGGLKRGKGETFKFSITHYIPLNLDELIDPGGKWLISCNLILTNNPLKSLKIWITENDP